MRVAGHYARTRPAYACPSTRAPFTLLTPLTAPFRVVAGILSEPGNENMTVDELVARLTAEGRSAVPNPVKAMLLQRISDFIRQNA